MQTGLLRNVTAKRLRISRLMQPTSLEPSYRDSIWFQAAANAAKYKCEAEHNEMLIQGTAHLRTSAMRKTLPTMQSFRRTDQKESFGLRECGRALGAVPG